MIFHIHHIIPKHAGGTDDPDNLQLLTVEEHAEAHRKLYEQYGRYQDKLAWLGLANLPEFRKEFYQETGRAGAKAATLTKLKKRGKPARKRGSSEKHEEYPAGVDGRKIRKNRFWYTDGIQHKQCAHEDAPPGWRRGKLSTKR